jgi:hypothetical protein
MIHTSHVFQLAGLGFIIYTDTEQAEKKQPEGLSGDCGLLPFERKVRTRM